MARSATIYPAVPARPAVSERPTFWDTAGSMWTPSEGWLAVALLLATNLVVVVAVQRSDWVEAMPKLWLVAPIGFAAGMALGKVRGNILYQILLHLLVLGLGLVLSLWQTTELVTQPTIAVRFDEVLSRLREWASTWNSSGSISNDRLPFATMLTAGTFLMAYVSAFALFKRRWTWIAIVIPAWGLLTNQTYLPSSRYPVPITLFMLFSVALLARMHYVSGMQRWNAQGMAKRLTPGSFLFNAVALTAIVFGIGWAMPTGHWTVGVLHDGYQAARQPWQDMEGQWERVFAGVPSKRASPLHNFGSALPLRGNVALGSDSVMTVTTDFPTYWRGQTYDVYQGQGWITSSAQRTTRNGQDVYSPSDSTGYKKRVAVAQKVTLHRESNVIFAAGEPLDVNVASQVEIAQPKTYDIDLRDGSSKTPLPADLAQAAQRLASARGSTAEMQKTLPPDTKIVREKGSTLTLTRTGPDSPDILSVKSSKSLKAESTYQVVSSVSIATDDDLHSDNATYQKWLADSYLQLPDGL
ncbi:MAG: hypothetical protein HY261_01095, partial [Chloroflexi bacterium]|nr:hypothetical protein [Chloroflexota bacterium]